MAVYTDVSEGELDDIPAGLSGGRLLSYKGIAEGSENSNFLLHTSAGAFILTLYEKRVDSGRPAVLPRPDGSPGREGHFLPAAGASQRRRARSALLAGRPAALITFLEGMWMRRPTVGHCREVGKALAELHLAGADFPLSRPNTLVDRRLAQALGRLARARRRGRARACRRGRRRLRRVRREMAERACRPASSMPTCFRTMSSSSARSCPA